MLKTTRYIVFILLTTILLASCVATLAPQNGWLSDKEHRVTFDPSVSLKGVFETEDLKLSYTTDLSESSSFTFFGSLQFSESLLNSFPSVNTFYLFVSFLDEDGIVIKTFDITPFYPYSSEAVEELKLEKTFQVPSGAKGLVFSYNGEFQSISHKNFEEWQVSHFPFK